MSATYLFNGGPGQPIPGGIFISLSGFNIKVLPTAINQVGTYTITVSVTDTIESITSSF